MNKAFSLVELSIVLVILGLLTGGILAGQNLIRAAELRSVVSEHDRYISAMHTFRDKYFSLPGDMRNATAFWGIAAGSTGNDTTCRNTDQSAGKATCNGDGDGTLETSQAYENYLFWKHLANAGLIEGNYSGTYANGSNTSAYTYLNRAVPGWNMPLSKLNNGVWFAGNLGGWNVAIQKFYGNYPTTANAYYHNSLFLYHRSLSPGAAAGGALSPTEAWGIDTKMDDGLPGKGRVEAYRGGSSNSTGRCLNAADPSTAEYDLDDDVNDACAMVFVGALK